MIQQNYSIEALPLEELRRIGLVKDGRFNVSKDIQEALLAGRRTELLRFENIETENYKIPVLDAKVSIQPDKEGKLHLLLHPIYKESTYPSYLTERDAEDLQSGQTSSVLKMIKDGDQEKVVMVEFDAETREFVVTDTNKIIVPELVNNEKLTASQKEQYRMGKEVELKDDTVFQYSAVEKQSIRSNMLALVASLLVDGGLTYALFTGLNYLFNSNPDARGRAKQSEGYKQALNDMNEAKNQYAIPKVHENVGRSRTR